MSHISPVTSTLFDGVKLENYFLYDREGIEKLRYNDYRSTPTSLSGERNWILFFPSLEPSNNSGSKLLNNGIITRGVVQSKIII